MYGTHDPIDARETTRQRVRCASPALCPDSTWQALTPALPICPAPRTPDSVSPARDRNERTQILKGPPELTIPFYSTNGNKRFSINGRTHTTGAHLPEMRPMCDAKNKSQIRQHKCNNLIRQNIFFQKKDTSCEHSNRYLAVHIGKSFLYDLFILRGGQKESRREATSEDNDLSISGGGCNPHPHPKGEEVGRWHPRPRKKPGAKSPRQRIQQIAPEGDAPPEAGGTAPRSSGATGPRAACPPRRPYER